MTQKQILAMATELNQDLGAVRQILRQPVEADIARGGLTGPQQNAMGVLLRSEGLSLKQLSQELGLAHSTVSGIVDRLEKQGLVKRETDGADRRLSKLVVSEQVRDYMRNTWPTLGMHPLAEALSAATPREQKEVILGIRTLRRLLESRNAKQPSRKKE